MKRVIHALLVLGVITFVGCDLKGRADVPGVGMKFQLHPAALAPRALTNLPVWTKAEARIVELVLDYQGPAGLVSLTKPTTSVLNLLTGTAYPALPSFDLGPGTYQNVNFGAELYDDGRTPSILLEGTWNGKNIRVVFISGEVFEAVAGTLTVAAGESYQIRVILNPADWFRSITDTMLNNAIVGPDGFIEISDSRNQTIFNEHFARKLDDATQSVLPGGTPN